MCYITDLLSWFLCVESNWNGFVRDSLVKISISGGDIFHEDHMPQVIRFDSNWIDQKFQEEDNKDQQLQDHFWKSKSFKNGFLKKEASRLLYSWKKSFKNRSPRSKALGK